MTMRKRRIPVASLLFVITVVISIGLAFRQSLIPPAWSPLPVLDLANPRGWTGGILIDWQLAELKRSPELCARVLHRPIIEHRAIPDKPYSDRCGWYNAVAVSGVGGVRIGANPLTCPMAAALAIWIEHDVKPLARRHFGTNLNSIQTMGTYSCRNIAGNPIWQGLRSQHAFANALDIAGFTLAGGRHISVQRHWRGNGRESKFLHDIHSRACAYFRVVLGPDFNAAHRDHFHLDRGSFWTCR